MNVESGPKRFFPFNRLLAAGSDPLRRERGQAAVRVALALSAVVAVFAIHATADVASGIRGWFAVVIGYTSFAILLALWVWRSTATYAWRRYLASAADAAAISYAMFSAGDVGFPMFVLYLWASLSNGFRFGVRALIVSTCLNVAGFAGVVWFSATWRAHPTLVVGVSLALVMLPLYTAHLLGLLHSAVKSAQEASAAKSQFLARMSHELRTPLNGILGSTDLLRGSRRLSRDERALLDVIEDSVNVSLRQIDNVLDFSKLEAGKLVLQQTDIDLHLLLNRCASMVRPAATQKGLRFLVRVAPDVPYRLIGDGHHLREILLNLLSNAVKFTERGSIWLEVSSEERDSSRVRLRFSIRDTGIGISPGAIERIFDSFGQQGADMAGRSGVAGLGASIAKQLVELMGGRIGVDSTAGSGTTFWFEIPFERHSGAPADDMRIEGRVLLLSEDPRVVESLRAILDKHLATAASAQEALTLLARAIRLGNSIHLLLIDDRVAVGADASHRCAELCDKAAAANVPTVLVSDAAPPDETLRAWGYSAVVARMPAPMLIHSLLHASPHRLSAPDPKVVAMPPWFWRGHEDSERPRILVADDNRTNLMITRRMLEQAGYAVDAVKTGDEALERLRAGGYRLAVLDMHMPGLDGPSVLRRYRVMRPRSRLPVIVLTANASVAAQHACADAGADAYLAKPVTARQLLSEVKRLLDDTEIEMLPHDDGRQAARAEADAQVLDLSVLAELDRIYSDPRELSHLVEEYEREGRELIERIAATCRARDHATYYDAVHALKSNAANVGARQLMEACRSAGAVSLVEFIRDRDTLLSELRDSFVRSLAALREIAKTAPSGGRGSSTA